MNVFSWHAVRLLLALGAAVAIVLEVIRLFVGLEWRIFERLTRPYERSNPAGYAVAVLAAGIVVWLFDPRIAVPAILLLTIVDPVAGVMADLDEVDSVDRLKSPWVMAATFGVALLVALPLLPLRAALPAAAVVVAADSIKPRVFGFVIDDNASIPLGAALTSWIILALTS
ncbi:MAG: dolichol kinase [Salinirussus sp.]